MTDRRWIDTGANVPDVRDADGLPQWVETRDGGIACGHRESSVAAWFFSMKGFDLPDFDGWLSALEPCGAKTELLERRALAIQSSKEGKRDAVLRHLEWMMLRRQFHERNDFLLPLARRGKAVADGGQKGGRKSAATRRGKASKRDAILAAAAAYDGSEAAKISSVARKTGASERYIRMVLAEEIRK